MCNGSPLSVNPIFHFTVGNHLPKVCSKQLFLGRKPIDFHSFSKKVSYLFVFCANEQMENSIKGNAKSHISVFFNGISNVVFRYV
jgi:hypothetical protein